MYVLQYIINSATLEYNTQTSQYYRYTGRYIYMYKYYTHTL